MVNINKKELLRFTALFMAQIIHQLYGIDSKMEKINSFGADMEKIMYFCNCYITNKCLLQIIC